MRCTRCGNENSDQNRFCGMCGASLLSTPAPKASEPQAVSVAASPKAAEVVAEPAQNSPGSVVERPASISGPSFLGLNDPALGKGTVRRRASLSIDPHSTPGSNLDYLLDEEGPTHHWGIGKILLILIALGLAAGFGYLRFKNQGLEWISGVKKPSAVMQNSSAPDTTAAPTSSPSITPDPQPPAQPPAAAPTQPTTAAPRNAPSDTAASSPGPATTSADTPAPADTAKPPDAAPPAANEDKAADKAAAPAEKESSTAKDESTDTPAAPTEPVEKPKPAPKAPATKPSPATHPASYDPVSEAQKYLYGRGAPQDCDRGLRLLRPAANQANPKAMIEMGALYSAGLCTPHDLPTAYRWFALALRKDPENRAVQIDLQKLWGEMTPPERQLAIKLTQ